MWPYTNDEAGWLTPHEQAEPTRRGSANDNDPTRRVAPRPGAEAPGRTPGSKDQQ